MSENPWVAVPKDPPYVLASDAALVSRFNERRDPKDKFFLHVDQLLPEPFLGPPDAPVILLSNNPGIGEAAESRKLPLFMARMRENLRHEQADYPFPHLDPHLPKMAWWRSKLKDLIAELGERFVARSVCNLVYFPYPSVRYRHGHIRLPSQQYVFHLVEEAMRRRAVIIRMRRNYRWVDAVRDLDTYDRLYDVRNPQAATINRGNFDHLDDVIRAIGVAEKARRPS